jgi:hypothetical protein
VTIRMRDLPPHARAAVERQLGKTAPPPATPSPYRSKLEAAYARNLELRRLAGEISTWEYEPRTFDLGKRRVYTPDFRVRFADGRVEWHEVKGYCRTKDAVRMDWFIDAYPTEVLVIVTRPKGMWHVKQRT